MTPLHWISWIKENVFVFAWIYWGSSWLSGEPVHIKTFWSLNPDLRPPLGVLSSALKILCHLNTCVISFFHWASLTELWICSPLTRPCRAASTLPKRRVNAEVRFDWKLVCNGRLSRSSLLRGKCAHPVGLQCRPHTGPDRRPFTGPLRCPGRVRQWAQYHSLHRQQRPGVRHKY